MFFSNCLEAVANTGQCILDTESIDKSHVVWVDDVTQDTVDGITGFFLFVSNYGIKNCGVNLLITHWLLLEMTMSLMTL